MPRDAFLSTIWGLKTSFYLYSDRLVPAEKTVRGTGRIFTRLDKFWKTCIIQYCYLIITFLLNHVTFLIFVVR